MTLTQLTAAIRSRLEAASPAPWTIDAETTSDGEICATGISHNKSSMLPIFEDAEGLLMEDAQLIANAPADLRTLLRIVEVQREALESVKRNYLLEHLNATSVDACGDKVYEAIALGDAIARGEGA